MKNKVISLVLALVMCLGLAIPASAADETPNWDGATEVEDYEAFAAAIADETVEKIKIVGEVTVPAADEALEANKPILVGTDGSLKLAPGAVVTSSVGMGLFSFEDSENTWTLVAGMCEAFLLWKDGDDYSRTIYGTLPEDVEAAAAEGKGDLSAMVINGDLALTKDLSADFLMVTGNLTVAEGVTLAASGTVGGDAAFAAEDQKPEGLEVAGEVTVPADEEEPVDETPAEDEKPENPFTDVADSSPFYNAILWAVEQGITAGTGDGTTFSPSVTCTRAQIITFLWRSAGRPETTLEESPFSDVAADAMNADFYAAILWAAENGMADGETFNPNDGCTRAMAVDFIWKAAVKAENEEIETPEFTDVDEDSPYMDGIAWAVAHEITMGTGDGTTFSPDNLCTRGQIVTFLYRTANTPVAMPAEE